MDVIGQIGSSADFGKDTTERRNAGITSGDPNGSDAFDFADEWTSFSQDTFDGLGTRSSRPGIPSNQFPSDNLYQQGFSNKK
jgi:hypothetical protein